MSVCKLLLYSVFLALINGLIHPVKTSGKSALKEIIERYQSVESQTIYLDQWKTRTNETGTIAWNTSRLLDSYVNMYEVTHDQTYLTKFMTLADPLVQTTDAKRNLEDYKGRVRTGWSSTAYAEGKQRVVYLVHSAMIVYPLARFAYVVSQNSALSKLASKASDYQQLAVAALGEFDADWRQGASAKTGYYVFEKGHPLGTAAKEVPLPFNMELAAGRVCIILWKLTKNDSYKERAAALARYFKENLQKDSSGGYVWNYAPVNYDSAGQSKPPQPEDFGHGAEDINFAVLAAQNEVVFTHEDLKAFAKAYFRYAQTLQKPTDHSVMDLWAPLSWESCSVYQAIYPHAMTAPVREVFLQALSELALYSDKCSPK